MVHFQYEASLEFIRVIDKWKMPGPFLPWLAAGIGFSENSENRKVIGNVLYDYMTEPMIRKGGGYKVHIIH